MQSITHECPFCKGVEPPNLPEVETTQVATMPHVTYKLGLPAPV